MCQGRLENTLMHSKVANKEQKKNNKKRLTTKVKPKCQKPCQRQRKDLLELKVLPLPIRGGQDPKTRRDEIEERSRSTPTTKPSSTGAYRPPHCAACASTIPRRPAAAIHARENASQRPIAGCAGRCQKKKTITIEFFFSL